MDGRAVIETERLLLRPLAEVDVQALRAVWGDAEVMTFCGGACGEARLRLAVDRCMTLQAERGFSPLAVLTRGDGSLIGACGLKALPDPAGAELIYHFRRSAWGRGYGQEATSAVLEWAKRLPLDYLEASFDPLNVASERILRKMGFRHVEDRCFEDVRRLEPVYRLVWERP